MIYAVAADVGSSAAFALVSLVNGERPRLVMLAPVYGDEHLWWPRAMDAAHAIALALRDDYGQSAGAVPCRVEVPPAKVRGGPMAHHATGHGLGMRAGLLRAAWFNATGTLPETWEPREWWSPLGIRKGKSETGEERIAQAGLWVSGAKEALADIPTSRRVDAAEGILQSAALAILSSSLA